VKQGCPLSPTLFAFATVGLDAWAKSLDLGYRVLHNKRKRMVMFADDLSAFIDSINEMDLWLQALNEWREVSGLAVAADKSKLWSCEV
jgi:hypothetical protein